MSFEISDKNSCADIGLIVRADSLEELLCQSALGITAITADPAGIEDRTAITIKLAENDLEDLYFSWLSELIYYKDTESFLTVRCEIEPAAIESDGYSITAVLHGDRMDRERHQLKLDIKAVTYYNFKILETDNHWHGEVVFDL